LITKREIVNIFMDALTQRALCLQALRTSEPQRPSVINSLTSTTPFPLAVCMWALCSYSVSLKRMPQRACLLHNVPQWMNACRHYVIIYSVDHGFKRCMILTSLAPKCLKRSTELDFLPLENLEQWNVLRRLDEVGPPPIRPHTPVLTLIASC